MALVSFKEERCALGNVVYYFVDFHSFILESLHTFQCLRLGSVRVGRVMQNDGRNCNYLVVRIGRDSDLYATVLSLGKHTALDPVFGVGVLRSCPRYGMLWLVLLNLFRLRESPYGGEGGREEREVNAPGLILFLSTLCR